MTESKAVNFQTYVETYLDSHLAPEQQGKGTEFSTSVNGFILAMSHVVKPLLSEYPNTRFEIGFLGTPGLNAYADEHDGSYIMAMHTEVFRCIRSFANACFADERFFRDIGEPDYTKSKKPDVTWSPAKAGEPETLILPPCPQRQAAAKALSQLMTRIVWLHEFAHCHNRHIRLLRKRGIGNRLSEAPVPLGAVGFPPKDTYRQQSELFQLLEADADHWAIETSLWLQFNGLEPIKAIAQEKPRIRVGLALFAIASVCWLLEHFNSGFNSSAHPPADLRRSLMVLHLARYVRNQRPDAKQLLVDIYKELGRIRSSIPEFYDLREILETAQSEDINQALLGKDSELTELRTELFEPR